VGTFALMSTYAADRMREAWGRYADRLRGLQGAEYEGAEREAWEALQAELRLIEGEPLALGASAGA